MIYKNKTEEITYRYFCLNIMSEIKLDPVRMTICRHGFAHSFDYTFLYEYKVDALYCSSCGDELDGGYCYLIGELNKQNLLPDNYVNYCCLCAALIYIIENDCSYHIASHIPQNELIFTVQTKFGVIISRFYKYRFKQLSCSKNIKIRQFFSGIKQELKEEHQTILEYFFGDV